MTDLYDLSKLKAIKSTFVDETERCIDVVIDVTDYDSGYVELQVEPNKYYRFRHEDLTAAIMAIRVRLNAKD